jgi:hypothetical protein
MGFAIHRLGGDEKVYRATQYWWLTADKSRVVPDGDPQAAHLLIAPNQTMPWDEAERYGLIAKELPQGDSEQTVTIPEAKAIDSPPEDKAIKSPPSTKGRKRK